MAFVSRQLQLPEPLKNAILSKKCVAYIGSGLSAGCYDLWPDLINTLCERCGSPSRVTQGNTGDAFLDAAEEAKRANEQVYYSFLGEHFGRPASRINLIYNTLLSLPFECYLTVNFDPLLAIAARTAKLLCDQQPCAYPSLDRKKMVYQSIHYLHGLIPEGSTPIDGTIVLARSEFEEAYAENSNLMNFLVATLEHDPVVFVGCALKEPVMSKVISICKRNQQKRLRVISGQSDSKPPPRFILLPEPEVKNLRGEIDAQQSSAAMTKEDGHYKTMGIEPVRYAASGGDHSALRLALDGLAGRPEISPNYGWEGGVYAT